MNDNTKPRYLDETDLAARKMGDNKLQGNDQQQVRNERREVPGVRPDTDSVIESFEKLDKDHRAETDLFKGARSAEGRSQ